MDDSGWKIDDADKNLKKGPGVSRYYAKKEIRCYNCDKEGHLSRDCPEPKVGHFIYRNFRNITVYNLQTITV